MIRIVWFQVPEIQMEPGYTIRKIYWKANFLTSGRTKVQLCFRDKWTKQSVFPRSPSLHCLSFYSFHPSFQSSLQMSVHFPFQTSFQNPFIPAIFLPYLLSSLFASRLPSFFPSCIHEYFKRWHWVMMIQCHTTVRLPGSNPGPVFFIHMPLGNLLKFPVLEISSFFT